MDNTFVAELAGAYDVDGVRIWLPSLGQAKADGKGGYTVTLKVKELAALKNQVQQLKVQGIQKIVAMPGSHVIPSDYKNAVYSDGKRYSQDEISAGKTNGLTALSTHTYLVVPSPVNEPEVYQKFMEVQQEYYRLLSEAIPEITHFETINEPEGNGGIRPVGYKVTAAQDCPDKNGYTTETIARICMDYNYAATAGVDAAGNGAVVLSPALTGTNNGKAMLQAFYQYIAAKEDKNPDHYFEILNWHPYVFYVGTEGGPTFGANKWNEWETTWTEFQQDFYKIAVNAGDGTTPVWFTEIGVTDCGRYNKGSQYFGETKGAITEEMAAQRLLRMLQLTEQELSFVKNAMVFRISDMEDKNTYGNDYEANFGLIERFDYCTSGAEALKDTGKVLYQFIHGGSKDYTKVNEVLNRHYKSYKKILWTENFAQCSVVNNSFCSYDSDTTLTCGSGNTRLQPVLSTVATENGNALSLAYGTKAVTANTSDIYGNICFALGKLEAGEYQVIFNLETENPKNIAVIYAGVTTASNPNEGVSKKLQELSTIKNGVNGITFTVSEAKNVYLYFQFRHGNVKQSGSSYVTDGTFQVLFDQITLKKTASE